MTLKSTSKQPYCILSFVLLLLQIYIDLRHNGCEFLEVYDTTSLNGRLKFMSMPHQSTQFYQIKLK